MAYQRTKVSCTEHPSHELWGDILSVNEHVMKLALDGTDFAMNLNFNGKVYAGGIDGKEFVVEVPEEQLKYKKGKRDHEADL